MSLLSPEQAAALAVLEADYKAGVEIGTKLFNDAKDGNIAAAIQDLSTAAPQAVKDATDAANAFALAKIALHDAITGIESFFGHAPQVTLVRTALLPDGQTQTKPIPNP